MPSKTEVQQWQLYNPLNKSSYPPDLASSNKLPYCKSSNVMREALQQPKVSSVGVAPPRNSMEVKDLNVMLVGNSISDQAQENGGDEPKNAKKSSDKDKDDPSENVTIKKQKMPAIINSEGTTTKPSFTQRAKPPPMPRSKVVKKRKPRLYYSFKDTAIHTTTPALGEDRESKSAMSKASTIPVSAQESSERIDGVKSVLSVEITDPSSSPVRSVDEMIQALRSTRQRSTTPKSLSDKKIDEIMKQVMSHAEEWMQETLPRDVGVNIGEKTTSLASSFENLEPEQTVEEDEIIPGPIDENEIDVSDTVSTLASQISVTAGIPDVSAILTRISSHARQGQSASETSSPAMMIAVEDEESVDLEQAERDFSISLDVRSHDILAVHGTNPPLIEKTAIALPSSSDDVLSREPRDDLFSNSIGGRIHRLCLLPSIKELNVSSKELALTNFLHSNPDPDIYLSGGGNSTKKDQTTQRSKVKDSGRTKPIDKKMKPSNIFDTSKLDPLDIDGWKRVVEDAMEDKDYTLAGSRTDNTNMGAWRLLWNAVPPKMALSTSAVKALVFPYYHGTKVIENEVEEKESWMEEDELSEIIIEDEKKTEFNERTIFRRHASVEDLSSAVLLESEETLPETELFQVPYDVVTPESEMSVRSMTPEMRSPGNRASLKSSFGSSKSSSGSPETPEIKSPRKSVTPDGKRKYDKSPSPRKIASPERKVTGIVPTPDKKKIGKVTIQGSGKLCKFSFLETRKNLIAMLSSKGKRQPERRKFDKKFTKKVSKEKEFEGRPRRRSFSLPRLSTFTSSTGSLRLMETDYSSAMEEVKHQREMIVRQQISQQQLKEAPITANPIVQSRDGKENEVTAGSKRISDSSEREPGRPAFTTSDIAIDLPAPSKTSLLNSRKRSFVVLGKKKKKTRKSKKFTAKLHRSLVTYTPMPLRRTLSHQSFFPPTLPASKRFMIRKRRAKSTRLRGKITRSTSVPHLNEFDWFVSRHLKYGNKIDDMREWVRDIWNRWFDQLFPPSDDESSAASISENLLDDIEDEEEAKEIKKFQSEIKKLPLPDKIPPCLIFLSEEIEEPEEIIMSVIDDLTRALSSLPLEKVVARACHLTKRGSLLRRMGEIMLANDDLDKAIQLEPRLASAYWQRHLIRLLRHQRHEALDDLNALIKIDSKNVHAYRSRGDIYASLGDYTMAIVNYSQAIKLDPHKSEAYFQRASIFEKTGDMLLAMEDYSSVHKLNPVRTDALLRRALYNYTKKSWLVAVSDFTQLISHEPFNSQARTYRARASLALGNFEKALKDFSAAIHFDPLNSVAYYHRGALLRKASPEKALQDLSVSLLLDSSERNVLALLHRGILYSETRKYTEALADFEHTLRMDGSIVCAQVNIGIIQMKVYENYWEAVRRFTAALKQDPTYTRAHVCRADAYARIHDYNSAVKDITRAIHLRPGERHLYLRRGKFLLQLRKLQLAAFCVQHIATLEKSFISTSATQQAVVQSFLGNHEEACESLSGACRRNPVPPMYVLLAKTLMKAKRFEDAISHLQHAHELTGIYTSGETSKVKESISEETRIHFLLGQCYMEMGRHDDALTSYNHALRDNSHFADAFYRRGLCKLKLGVALGIQDLNRALALDPDLFEAYLSRSSYYSTKKRYSKAILNCNEALRLRPRSVRALLCRGALKYCIGAYYHAINDLSQAVDLDKRCALAYYNRAVCLHRTQKHQEALKDYSIALVLAEIDDSEAGISFRARVFVNRALLYLCSEINDAANAAYDLELAATLRPNDTGILHAMSICYHKMQNLPEAHYAYSRCLQVNPSFLAAYVGRGDVYGDAGEFEKAKVEYERALGLDPTYVDAHVHLGYNLHMCGHLHQAWMEFSKALEFDPNCLSALEGRAVTCLHANDVAAASRDISVAMKCGRPSARLLTVCGVVEQYQNGFQSAMAHYNKAQAVDPLYTPAHFNAAVLYMRERRFTDALESLQVVIRANPTDSAALLNRAIVRVFLNETGKAMTDFDYALKLDPKNSHIFYNRGNLRYMLEDYDSAVNDYSSALDINPSDFVTLKRRADTKGRLGKKEEAIEDYQQSLILLERHERLLQLRRI